jgi:cytochrome P450
LNVERMGDQMAGLIVEEVSAWRLGAADLWQLSQELIRTVAVALLYSGDQERGWFLADLLRKLCEESKSVGVYMARAGFPGRAYTALLARAEGIERCAMDLADTRRGVTSERDLISRIVNSPDENGAAPSDDVLASQIPVLFGSSYETCQTVLTWTLFLLAQHPSVANDLADEISSALGGGPPSLAKVTALPLLDGVIREAMRILPPVPYQTRIASRATQLGGHPLSAGTYVLLSAFLTNRSPSMFTEPARFKPERWSNINPTAFEYLAFSAGPRACPGAWFGMAMVKVAVAAILSSLRISVVPGARVDYRVAITMAPRNGLPVVLHQADGGWSRAPVCGQLAQVVDMAA